MVVGTIDMALWDALARAMDVPLAVLLGGEIRSLTDLSAIAPAVWRLRAAMATISVPFGMKRDAVSGVWIDSR
jgi:L-alanine-DL-glutamate epimerase-like enolase superfamily enzyme